MIWAAGEVQSEADQDPIKLGKRSPHEYAYTGDSIHCHT